MAAPAGAARPVKVLVTGAAGFVGYTVSAALVEAGHDVVGLIRRDSFLPDGVRPVLGDLLDSAAVRTAVSDVEAVCHLAALARVRDSRTNPLGYWRTNVGGTLTLLESMVAAGVSRLVVASTCVVYGERVPQPIGEDARTEPTSPYGASKLAADRAVADLASAGEIGAISLRPFNVAGGTPGRADSDETRLIPKIVAVIQGRAAGLAVNGDGSVVRDYVHVADMADAFVRALGACELGRWTAYNVGSGQSSTIADVIAAAEEVAGVALPVRHNPPADEPRELQADATRITAELGWQPERSQLRRIIEDALRAAQGAYSPRE